MNIGIIAKLKQGDLLEAMITRGWNQRQLGEYLGLDQNEVGRLINMKWSGSFPSELEAKLIELTGKTLEQLFPAQIMTAEFRRASKTLIAFRNAEPEELLNSGIRCLPPFEHRGGKEDLVGVILTHTERLTSREKEVFFRNINGESNEEIADKLNVTVERVEQIRTRAFKKVRSHTKEELSLKKMYPIR